MLPIDIINSIKLHLTKDVEQLKILKQCEDIKMMNLNVGSDQLIRSLLILTDYNADKIEELIKMKFGGDPRDILVEANKKQPNLNYGNAVFEK